MPELTIKCSPPNSKPILHTSDSHGSIGEFIKSLVDIPYAHLSGQILLYEDLSSINMQYGHMRDVVLYHAVLCSTNMSNCWLIGANLQHVDAQFANFSKSKMLRADLAGADCANANFNGADLRQADLRGADLRGADLRQTNLRGANLRGAKLRGAKLTGAVIDAKTQGLHLDIQSMLCATPPTPRDVIDALTPDCPIPVIADHAHGSFYRIIGPVRKRVSLAYVLARVTATNTTENHAHVIVNKIIDWVDYTLPHATLTFIAHK